MAQSYDQTPPRSPRDSPRGRHAPDPNQIDFTSALFSSEKIQQRTGAALPPTAPTFLSTLSVEERLLQIERRTEILRGFLDVNSAYASWEQQQNKQLRGKPLIVVTEVSNYTTAIAASPEAKALGISTGTLVGDAKVICPEILVIKSRPEVYFRYHAAILNILRDLTPAATPYSIDEMSFELMGGMQRADFEELGRRIKNRFNSDLGSSVKCSIGFAPNVFLAKVATEMQKRDGLTVLGSDYPVTLSKLPLTKLPGIADAMEKRLSSAGLASIADLYLADAERLRSGWQSITGVHWYHMLRGSLECDYLPPGRGQALSIGRSHVLPPALRNLTGATEVLHALLEDATYHLRSEELDASRLHLGLIGFGGALAWTKVIDFPIAISDYRSIRAAVAAYPPREVFTEPAFAYVRFAELSSWRAREQDLFTIRDTASELQSRELDILRRKLGSKLVRIGQYKLPLRISFGPPNIEGVEPITLEETRILEST